MAKPSVKMGNLKSSTSAPSKVNDEFTVTVTTPVGAYEEGHTLDAPKHQADYFRQIVTLAAANGMATDKQVESISKATDDAIVARLKGVDVSDLEPADANDKRFADLLEAPFQQGDPSQVPTSEQLRMSGSNASTATRYGALVDSVTDGVVSAGIEGQIEADACPIKIRHNLKRQFDSVMEGNVAFLETVPPMRTKYIKGAKGNRAPWGYRNPGDDKPAHLPVWQGPWNKSRVENRTGNPSYIDTDWIDLFVASTPGGKPWQQYADHLRAAAKGARIEGPNALTATMVQKLNELLESKDEEAIAAELGEAAFQFQRRSRWYTNAFELDQALRACNQHFAKLKVESYGERQGETPEMAARRRLPFCIVTSIVHPTDKTKEIEKETRPFAMSKVVGIAKRLHELPANSLAGKVLEVKRGKPAGGDANKDEPGKNAIPEFKTVSEFEQGLSSVANFAEADGAYTEIMNRATSPADAGQLASAIVTTHAKLSRMAGNADVQRLAARYNEDAAKAQADANNTAPVKVKVDPKTGRPLAA